MPNDRHAIVARSVQTEPPQACYMQTDEVVELPGLPPLLSCLYLFASTIPGGIVGAFITFAGPGLYDVYPDAPRIWGISV